ncbi:MAG TPA: alpha/beta fold hydrolase [Sphingobium sp.]|nr:alpha/beta fold hydrolase [Sphingobium sp.]
MTDAKTSQDLPNRGPTPTELADAWTKVIGSGLDFLCASMGRMGTVGAPLPFDPTAPARAMLSFYQEAWRNPAPLIPLQKQAAVDAARLAVDSLRRLAGEQNVESIIAPARGDRRFKAPEWTEQPVFDYVKQAYLLTAQHAMDMVAAADGLPVEEKRRLEFYTRQFLDALSPANFAFTNPEAIRKAIDTGSISLLSGLANMLADAASPAGMVRRRGSDDFELGVNLASTPGSVVFENKLMQLIQYAPTTETVYRRPLLYVPPLVNKYYFLDLTPQSSLIRWLVEQGHTVFTISWVNPGEELAEMGIDDYINYGPIAALDAIEAATGEREVGAFSFCMGGTLLAMALAYLAASGQGDRVTSATMIGTLLDFSDIDQWVTFTDPAQVKAFDKHVTARGVLSAQSLQALFALVRSNDLIWPSVVSHYLLDQELPPSDLLFWFADGAQIPGAYLKAYVRDLMVENRLVEPHALKINGIPIDLGDIEAPLFAISLKDDHVSGWTATYNGVKNWGADKTFLLGGSGHNAGVINPPTVNKHGHWTSESFPATPEQWLEGAVKHDGSWWPKWQQWLTDGRENDRVSPRIPGDRKLRALESAPGSFVTVRW